MTDISNSEKEAILHFLSGNVEMPDKDFEKILCCLKKRSFKKGEIILQEGATSSINYLLLDGMIHQYSIVDGKLFTINIAIPGMAINSFISYFEQKPSYEIHEAIKDTTVLCLEKSDADRLLQESHAFCLLYLMLYKKVHLEREKRSYLLMHKLASKRFELFITTHVRRERYLNEVPQKLIANYLGLTPETYSRVKKAYYKKV